MKKIIIGLLILVVLIFLMFPGLIGRGQDIQLPFAVATADVQTVETGVSCSDVNDCYDYVSDLGGDASQLVNLRCKSDQCMYDIPEMLTEVAE